MLLRSAHLKYAAGERGQDGGGVGGHARPLPQTQQKKSTSKICCWRAVEDEQH